MALPLTANLIDSINKQAIQPNMILQIEGVDTLYSIVNVKDVVRVGDDVFVGEEYEVGQIVDNTDQSNYILLEQGTTTEIRQSLSIDKGTSESISSMRISLIDKNQEITRLISPGFDVVDILSRKCKVWFGLSDLVFPDDYNLIFSGVVDAIEAKAGRVDLSIASPDTKKKGIAFAKGETKLSALLNAGSLTALVEDTTSFLSVYAGPGATIDADLQLYIKIDDEIIRYEGSTGTSFTSLTRGAFGTTDASHSLGATVDSFYVISGNAIDLALKLMMSGKDGPYVLDVPVTSFGHIGHAPLANAIYFNELNPEQSYGIRTGDYITTTGASNGANNVTDKEILSITEGASGWYLVIDGVSFVQEIGTAGTVGFRSQYDVWGPGAGLSMGGDEVDVAEHIDIQLKYLSSAEYRFYLKDTIEDGLEFIGEQIYRPVASYSIPRKSKASVGYHSGPVPGLPIKTLDTSNVLNANELAVSRSITSNFYNTVIYKFEEDALEERFKNGVVFIDGTSVSQIPIGNRALIIESNGLRVDLSGVNNAQQSSNRRLLKYKFAAESIKNVTVNFKTGFDLEIGDKVIVDMTGLKLADISTGTRSGASRLFDITNKSLNIRNGQVRLELVDSNFNLSVRYALIAPASFVLSGASSTQFTIKPSFNLTRYGNDEYKKWQNFIGAGVVVRNASYSISSTSTISSVNGNVITVSPALSFTPALDYIMEFSDYDNQTENVKLIYGFLSDGDNNFGDGKPPYQMS